MQARASNHRPARGPRRRVGKQPYGSPGLVSWPPAPALPDTAGARAPAESGECCSVLVVDDDPVLASLVGASLAQDGFTVHQARTLPQAFTVLHEVPVQLIVTDLIPSPLGALATVPALAAQAPGIPIIVTTGHIGLLECDPSLAPLAPGVVGILAKPYALAELTALLHAHLAPAPAEP